MTPELARNREALYREVEYGRRSSAEADTQLKKWGQRPFQRRRADLSSLDPMTEAEWTLPMAAAWFIWRSHDAVRDQWNPTRQGWQKWVRTQKRRRQAGDRLGPLWQLKRFERATLEEVFSQAGFFGRSLSGKRAALESAPLGSLRSPYSRLKDALQTGLLPATWGMRSDGDGGEIPKEYWERNFDKNANPRVSSTRRIPAQNSPGLKVNAAIKSAKDRPAIELVGDENDAVFVRRDDVLKAALEISKREYEGIYWDFTQVMGWIAYRTKTTFRSLWKIDVAPVPKYYEEMYDALFVIPDPLATLKDALTLGHLIAILNASEVKPAEWHELSIWKYPDAKCRSADVLKLWGENNSAEDSPRPRMSEAAVERLYKDLLDANGGKIGKNKAYSILQSKGATRPQVRTAADKLDPSANERGRKKKLTPLPEK